ncbi:hypothetical protein D3C87_2015040 [compost metagenome]
MASISSIRATAIPDWMTCIATFTAWSMLSNEHTAAQIDSGTGCRRNVISLMMPRVPSLPTIKWVRS